MHDCPGDQFVIHTAKQIPVDKCSSTVKDVLRDLIGSNNNHNIPYRPQSWSEFTATTNNRWQGGPGITWGAAPNGPIDTMEQPAGDINRTAKEMDTKNQAHLAAVEKGDPSAKNGTAVISFNMDGELIAQSTVDIYGGTNDSLYAYFLAQP